MSETRNLLRRTVRHVCARLERLYESLQGLGRRLHDSVAQLVGSHVGEAVREAILAALQRALPGPPGHAPPRPQPRWGQHADSHGWQDHSRQGPYDEAPPRQGPYDNEPYHDAWGAGAYPDDHLDDHDGPGELRGRTSTLAAPATDQSAAGWLALLPPVVQLADWWLQRLPGRPNWLRALAVGAAAVVGAVTAGPLAGALTATATALAVLSSLAGHV